MNLVLRWIWVVSCLHLFVGCLTSKAPQNEQKDDPSTDTDSDSDTDIDTDIDTDTDPPHTEEQYEACFFKGVGDGTLEKISDIETLGDGSFVASTSKGRVLRVSPEGTVTSEMNICSLGNCSITAVDKMGSTGFVLTGHFLQSLVFDSGGSNETQLDSYTESAMFLAVYDDAWDFSWAKRAAGGAAILGRGVGSYVDGSVLVVGIINDNYSPTLPSAVFGEGEAGETVIDSTGSISFLAKYNADGSLLWATKEARGLISREVVTFANGSFVTAGTYVGAAMMFGAGRPGATVLTNVPLDSTVEGQVPDRGGIWIGKFNADSSLSWINQASANSCLNTSPYPALLSDGSLALSGTYFDVVQFTDSAGTAYNFSAFAEAEGGIYSVAPMVFLARFTESGDLVFALSTLCNWKNECGVMASNPLPLPGDKIAIVSSPRGAIRFGSGDATFAVVHSPKRAFTTSVYDNEGNLDYLATLPTEYSSHTSIDVRLSSSVGSNFFVASDFSEHYEVHLTDGGVSSGTALADTDPLVARFCPNIE